MDRPDPGPPSTPGAGLPFHRLRPVPPGASEDTSRRWPAGEAPQFLPQSQQARALEAIGLLASGIAHDFNNMLNAILGYADLLAHALPADSQEHADALMIKEAGHRASDLVRQILAFSRPNGEGRQPLCLQLILKEALKLLRGSLPATITIRQRIDPGCPKVLADLSQMHQLILDLCLSAYHALGDSGGLLEVGLAPVTVDAPLAARVPGLTAGSYLTLAVHAAEARRPSGQAALPAAGAADDPHRRLAAIHTAAVAHRGAVATGADGAASITVYLPVIEEGMPANGQVAALPPAVTKLAGRVLLVDDVEMNVSLCCQILERLGCSAVGFTSSVEALAQFRAAPEAFDLVITDQTMPELTGEQLARHLLTLRPDLPVIMVTGHSNLVDQEKAKAAGIREFLMKPLAVDALTAVVARLLPEGLPGNSSGPAAAGQPVLPRPGQRPGAGTVRDFLRAKYRIAAQDLDALLAGAVQSLADLLAQGEAVVLAGSDPAALGQIAHTLKGTLANLGLREWASLAAEVADRRHGPALAGDGDQLAAQWTTLRQGLAAVIDELHQDLPGFRE
ncbi:MAG: response regulator [Thermodesulfobacteriota bacterium]